MSAPPHLTRLPDRTVIRLSGADRVRFLQGLVTADINAVVPGLATWAACLTPQGRWQSDFFVIANPDEPSLLLDCAAEQAETLRTTLLRFRLRADVQLDITGLPVHVAWGNTPDATLLENAISVTDPRLQAAGWRLIDAPADTPLNATPADYDLHRLALGLPDGVQDCEPARTLAAEANMDLLGGISWEKGCYMGQEVTARMRYRGLLKRRLVPVASPHPLPPPGNPILRNGVEVGTLRSSRDHIGLAILKLDALAGPLDCAGLTLVARPPGWMADALTPDPSSTPTAD